MRGFGILLILGACVAFASAFLDLNAGLDDGSAMLAVLGGALLVSGSVFATAAGLADHLRHARDALPRRLPAEREPAPVPVQPDERDEDPAAPAIRRPGFQREAA